MGLPFQEVSQSNPLKAAGDKVLKSIEKELGPEKFKEFKSALEKENRKWRGHALSTLPPQLNPAPEMPVTKFINEETASYITRKKEGILSNNPELAKRLEEENAYNAEINKKANPMGTLLLEPSLRHHHQAQDELNRQLTKEIAGDKEVTFTKPIPSEKTTSPFPATSLSLGEPTQYSSNFGELKVPKLIKNFFLDK